MGYPQESEDLSEQLPSIHIHSKFKSVPVLRQIAKSLATATPPATAQLPCNMSTVLHVKGLEGSPQNIFLLPLHIRKLPLPWL
jgi:hypothetical protein